MPRQKLTAPVAASPAADLPDLTDQQMTFVQALLEGLNATDAYRRAYDCTDWSPSTVWANASRLRSEDKVQTWIAAAREAHLDRSACTLEHHVNELGRLKEIAIRTGNVGAAVAAEQSRGKASGHYVERFEDVTAKDPMNTIEAIKRIDPELAARLTRQFAPQLIEQQVDGQTGGQRHRTEPLCVTVETSGDGGPRG
jgi:phage terminase small subunit